MALEVGSAFARLGARVDDDGFQRFERRLAKAREEGKRGVVTRLRADADTTGLDRYERRVKDVDRAHGDLVRGSTRLRAGLGSIFIGGAAGAVATAGFYGLEKAVRGAFGAYKESERVGKQTNAVLKSTGEAAGVSAKHVNDLANAISKKTGIDDEAIQSGENLLLTFTNIRNETGKGNDIFDRTTKIMADMSAALGQDTKSSAIQLGKALNDPIKGVTALQRVGVSFTKDQKEQIKGLVEHGKTLDAQKLILRELNKEFGGSAAATATSSAKLRVTFGNLAESVGRLLSPSLERAAGTLNRFITGITDGTGKGGRFVGVLRTAGGAVRTYFVGAIEIARRVLDGIKSVLADRSKQLEELGTIGRRIANRLIGAVRQIAAAFAAVFSGRDGIGGDLKNIGERLIDFMLIAAKVADAITKRSIPGIVTVFKGLATILKGVIRVISGLLSGDFSKAWDGVKTIFRGAVRAIGGIVKAGTAPLRAAASAIGRGIDHALDAAWKGILGKAEDFINTLIDVVNAPLKVLGIKTIGHVDLVKDGPSSAPAPRPPSGANSPGRRAVGGRVDQPIIIMGEEAPQYPEWVIPVNPAYRERAVGLWMQAGRDLGVAGFAKGGRYSQSDMEALWVRHGGPTGIDPPTGIRNDRVAGAVGMAESGGDPGAGASHPYHGLWQVGPGGSFDPDENAIQAIGKWKGAGGRWTPWEAYTGPDGRGTDGPWRNYLGGGGRGGGVVGAIVGAVKSLIPDIHWPEVPDLGPFTGIPRAALNRVKDYVKDKISSFGGGGGGGGPAGSTTGLVPQVLRAIDWARHHGWHGTVTSGFRSRAKQEALYANRANNPNPVAVPGTSMHERGLAVDVTDPGAFNAAMQSAPANSRLIWFGPGDPVHFSTTGHRRGGRIPFQAFKKGGHRKGKKGAPAPKLSAKANRGIVRSVQRGEAGIRPFEDAIKNLERDYDLTNRRADLDPDDFLVENEDGSVTIDVAAQNDRRGELSHLASIRSAVEAKIRQYRAAVHKAIATYTSGMARLRNALKAAKGKARSKERAGYREKISAYAARRKELRGVEVDLGYDLQDAGIDLDELHGEQAALEGARATPAPPAAPADAPTPPDPVDAATPAPAAPTAEDIAGGVAAALASFNAGRAELFSSFGGNFMRPGQQANELDAAAGARYFGAGSGGTRGGVLAAGGAPQITQQITFTGPQPADPHTFTQAALHELKAAI